MQAARVASAAASDDAGFREAAYLMAKIVAAARGPNGAEALSDLGIKLSPTTSTAELAMVVAEEWDRRMSVLRQRSDFGELAGKALVGTLVGWVKERVRGLFTPSPESKVSALREAGTRDGFEEFARTYFERLTRGSSPAKSAKSAECHFRRLRSFCQRVSSRFIGWIARQGATLHLAARVHP